MAKLDVYRGGSFPFGSFAGFVPFSRSATEWVLQDAGAGRWLTITGTNLPTDPLVDFPNGGLVVSVGLSVVQVPAGDADRIFLLTELNRGAAAIAPTIGDATTLAAALLPFDDLITLATADGPVTLSGGSGADTITGSAFADSLAGGNGNDVIDGGTGSDRLLGGEGADSLVGGAGGDRLDGGNGDDTLEGGNGENRLVGGAGNDLMSIGHGRDFVDGGAGNDTLFVADSQGFGEVLRGGAGVDTLRVDGFAQLYANIELSGWEELQPVAQSVISFDPAQWAQFALVSSGEPIFVYLMLNSAGAVSLNSAEWDKVSVRNFDGSAGDDTVVGLGATAILEPGTDGDADFMQLNGGDDRAYGDSGADTLFGGTGGDLLVGEEGDDSLTGEAQNDFIYGDEGNDWIDGGSGNDFLQGGEGNDTIYAGEGNDVSYGQSGADYFYGETGNDTIGADAGDDIIHGGAGADSMQGGQGNDFFSVEDAGDIVTELAGQGADTVQSHVDITLAPEVEVLLLGPVGNLTGIGNAIANRIYGNNANNALAGLGDNDQLYGQGGNDTMNGDAGADRLHGGPGADLLYGGTGTDRFLLTAVADSAPAGADTIGDFNASGARGATDLIDLSAIDANPATLPANDAFDYRGFAAAFTGTGQLRLAAGPGGSILVLLNTDADLAAEAQIVVTVTAGALDASDFIL